MNQLISLAAMAAALVATPASAKQFSNEATAADAFVADAEQAFLKAVNESEQAGWVYQTYITEDTEAIAARAEAALTGLNVRNAIAAANFAKAPGLSYDTARKLDRIQESGANSVVVTDVSCGMHMAGGLRRRGSPIRVRHLADVLATRTPST
mgnify:CR=1 FL=1